MVEVIFKIWFMLAILPLLVFIEGSGMFGKFLKKRDIYHHWDIWHSALVFGLILLFILYITGNT